MIFKNMLLALLVIITTSCSQPVNSSEIKSSFCIEGVQVDANKESPVFMNEIPFVQKYLSMPYKERYGYFSEKYQQGLARAFGIKNSDDYEELQKRENYGRTILNSRLVNVDSKSEAVISILLLACWEQEGYSGLETYILDLKKIEDKWKISHIAH